MQNTQLFPLNHITYCIYYIEIKNLYYRVSTYECERIVVTFVCSWSSDVIIWKPKSFLMSQFSIKLHLLSIKTVFTIYSCCSLTQSCPALCNPMDCSTPGFTVRHCPSLSPGVCSNSYSLSQWCHPTTSSSVIPFSSCLQSSPASESFLMSRLFESGGQSLGASASASVLPINIQDWFPLGLTVWLALQSKGLSRVFSNTTVQKHQFFSAQPSLWSYYV